MGQPIVVPYIAIFEEINGKKMEPVEGGLVGISLCMSITASIISHTNNLEIPQITFRARNNGRSTENVETDCGFDWSKFNRIENEINLRFLQFSFYLLSRCVLRNFDMKSW